MKEFTYVIKEELGLHARPAGLLVKEAKKFQSATTLAAKGKTCLLYTSPSPRDGLLSRMPSSA